MEAGNPATALTAGEPHDANHKSKRSRPRLSRKEQKMRKKQRKQRESNSASNNRDDTDITIVNSNSEERRRGEQQQQQEREQESNYLDDYQPIPIPNRFADDAQCGTTSRKTTKWFPKAKVLKSTPEDDNNNNNKSDATNNNDNASSLLLFYQYADPPWPESKVQVLMHYLEIVAPQRHLGGRIRVAPEGVNATISSITATSSSCSGTASAARHLRHFCQDLREFDSAVFARTDFKFIDDLPADRHFKDFKILPVKELVFYGFSQQEAPLDKGGVHLPPEQYHEMLSSQKGDAVVIDVRNHYEAAIGRFDGQQRQSNHDDDDDSHGVGGAEYLDPHMRKSTDFGTWLAKPETQEKLRDKTVLMYCTGGVRCERASAYLNEKMGDSVKGIYQLQGGIEKYLQTFPDGGHWRGKNFVFDKREAVSADNKVGDGGVLRRGDPKQQETSNSNKILTHCCLCGKPWDRYVGKRKCRTCGVPVLVCDACLSQRNAKKCAEKARCPLCVEEDITVPVSEVEYTQNGVAATTANLHQSPSGVKKAAASVLKWGGGFASAKKNKRRMKRRMCQFGSNCMRPDCLFMHPHQKQPKAL